MRGVTRARRRNAPSRDLSRNASKRGGAKNRAERRGGAPRYKRGGSATFAGFRASSFFDPVAFSGPFVQAMVGRERGKAPVRGFLPRVRRSRCGPEIPLVGRSVRHFLLSLSLSTPSVDGFFLPPIRTETAPENPVCSPKPRPWCRAANTCGARHELADHAGELGVAVTGEGLDAHREVATSVSFGFCVNVCVWRQSCKVELCKCACVNYIRL